MKRERMLLATIAILAMVFFAACGKKGKTNSARRSANVAGNIMVAPVNLKAIPGDGQIRLTWSPNTDMQTRGYNVYFSTASTVYGQAINIGNVVENGLLSYTVTGLMNGQIHFFAVAAYNINGKEMLSAEISAVPQVLQGDLIPPATPINLMAAPGNLMVDLSWSPVADIDVNFYEVIYGTAAGTYGNPINAGNVLGIDGRFHYVISGLQNGTLYYFTVHTVDTSGNRSGNAIERSAVPQAPATTDAIPPAAPINLVATPGDAVVDLQWSANTDADLFGYQVWIKQTGQSYPATPINVGNITGYQASNLINGVQYTFAITAVDNTGNQSGLSVEVSVIPFAGIGDDTTPPVAPIGLWLSPGNGIADVGWIANTESDLSGYVVYIGRTAGTWDNSLNIGNRTTWRFTGLTSGQTYLFSVQAYDVAGNSGPLSPAISGVVNANATITFREQLDERISLIIMNADLSGRLQNGTVPTNITQLCWNSDVVGTYPNSIRCANYNLAATSTTIPDIPADAFHRLEGTICVVSQGTAYYLDLGLWNTNPSFGIQPSAQGGSLEINLMFRDLPPAAPRSVTAVAGNGQASIAWTANGEIDLAGYRIHYGTTSGLYGLHLNVGSFNGYLLQQLKNGTTYYITVSAYDRNTYESFYSNEVAVAPTVQSGPDLVPPGIPQNLVAISGDGIINLYWSRNLESDFASYTVRWGTAPGSYSHTISSVSITSQQISGLTNGVAYYFAVSAVDASGNESVPSIEQSAIPDGAVPDTTPPNPPVNLVVTAGNGSVSLHWSDNIEADLGGYRIRCGTSSGIYGAPIDVGSQTSYFLAGLTNGMTYYVVVSAYDNSPNRNESSNSAEVNAIPRADLPPAAPTGLVAITRDSAIDLAWNNNGEADLGGYIINYSTSSGNYTGHVVIGNVNVYRLSGLVNGQRYFIAITAYDQVDHASGYSNEVNAVPVSDPDTTPPLRPENLSATPGSSLVDLCWSANLELDVASYRIYWGTSSGTYPNVVPNIQPSRRVSGLIDDTRYFFAISAVDTAGNESALSIERSAIPNGTIPDVIPPAPPVNLTATPGNQRINLNWSPNVGAGFSHYNLRFGVAPTTYGAPINLGNATTYQLNSLTNGTNYYLVLTAVDVSGNESGYSVEVMATPMAGSGDITPPAAPTGLTAAPGDGFVDLQWLANSEPDLWGYYLYVGMAHGVYDSPLNLGNRISYQVSSLANGTEYYFVLAAYDSSGNISSYSNEVTAIPTIGAGGSGPNMPTGFVGEIVGGNVASLSWNPNADNVAGYNLSWGTTLGDYAGHAVFGNLTSTTLGLDKGVTYYFILQSRDWDGKLSAPAGPINLTP